MWPSARFRRSANVLGLSSVDLQKSLKNCRTILRRRSSSCWLGVSSILVLVWFLGWTTILSASDAKPSSSCWLGLCSVLMFVWVSGRTSAPDVKPPPAVLLSVSGRDLPLPGPASVLKNSSPIVIQLDIFEPRQETEKCRRGGLELRLRSLRGVQPRIIRGWRAGWRLCHEEH